MVVNCPWSGNTAQTRRIGFFKSFRRVRMNSRFVLFKTTKPDAFFLDFTCIGLGRAVIFVDHRRRTRRVLPDRMYPWNAAVKSSFAVDRKPKTAVTDCRKRTTILTRFFAPFAADAFRSATRIKRSLRIVHLLPGHGRFSPLRDSEEKGKIIQSPVPASIGHYNNDLIITVSSFSLPLSH